MISVVIAAYNGGEYIAQQLSSVLPQLDESDEVVISDDLPSGSTAQAVSNFLKTDKRVKYINGPGKGVIKNFENAINYASGDYIFLCDQDDVWLEGKVSAVMESFKSGASVVMHDAYITDGSLNIIENSLFQKNGAGLGRFKNIIKNTYTGCCMAFDSNLKKFILPFPDAIPMHDQWIGLIGEKTGKVALIDKPYIYYRRHDGTATGGKTSFLQKIKWRADIIRCLSERRVDL